MQCLNCQKLLSMNEVKEHKTLCSGGPSTSTDQIFLINVDLLMLRPMEKSPGVDVGYLSKILFCSPVLGIAFLMLFCAVFIHISVRFCSVLPPHPPTL